MSVFSITKDNLCHLLGTLLKALHMVHVQSSLQCFHLKVSSLLLAVFKVPLFLLKTHLVKNNQILHREPSQSAVARPLGPGVSNFGECVGICGISRGQQMPQWLYIILNMAILILKYTETECMDRQGSFECLQFRMTQVYWKIRNLPQICIRF